MRGATKFAEQVSSLEILRVLMKRHLAGVIGDNTTRVDNYSLGLRPAPVLPPPADVVLNRIDLGDVGLPPPSHTPIPGRFAVFLIFAAGKTFDTGNASRGNGCGFQKGPAIQMLSEGRAPRGPLFQNVAQGLVELGLPRAGGEETTRQFSEL